MYKHDYVMEICLNGLSPACPDEAVLRRGHHWALTSAITGSRQLPKPRLFKCWVSSIPEQDTRAGSLDPYVSRLTCTGNSDLDA